MDALGPFGASEPEVLAMVFQMLLYKSHIIPSLALQACKARKDERGFNPMGFFL